jgi:hypothetical protein
VLMRASDLDYQIGTPPSAQVTDDYPSS